MTDRISLNLDESNDVRFDVKITSTGAIGGPSGPDVMLRLVCESQNGVEYSFKGKPDGDGTVQVIVPPMTGVMSEGVYEARLEVVVEGRYFVPLQFAADFKMPLKVVAEGVRVVGKHAVIKDDDVNVAAAVKVPVRQTPVQGKQVARNVVKLGEHRDVDA